MDPEREFTDSGKRARSMATALPVALVVLGVFELYRAGTAEVPPWSNHPGLTGGVILLRILLAGLAAAFGAAALHYGLRGIRDGDEAVRQSRESPEAAALAFKRGIDRLPGTVTGLGVCMALGVASALLYETLYTLFTYPIVGRAFAVIAAFGGLAFIYYLLFAKNLYKHVQEMASQTFEEDVGAVIGQRLRRSDAPELHRLIGELAECIGADPPDEVVLGLGHSFFVTDSPLRVNDDDNVTTGRVLHLPLACLDFMPRDELRAVIGHELGHFRKNDPETGRRFAPLYPVIVAHLIAILRAMEEDSHALLFPAARPVLRLVEYFLLSARAAHMHWSRVSEFAADRTGADAAGREAMALALLRLGALHPAMDRALGEYWERGGGDFDLVERMRTLLRENGGAGREGTLEQIQPHPTDSHPPVRMRLEALGMAATKDLLQKAHSYPTSQLLELGLDTTGEPLPTDGSGGAARHAVQGAFSQKARENFDAEMKELAEIGKNGIETVDIYENVTTTTLMAAVGCLCCCGIGLIAISTWWGILLFLAGGVIGWYAVHIVRRSRAPFITLTPTGFFFPRLEEEIQWTSLHSFQVSVSAGSVIAHFLFEEGKEPQRFKSDGRATWNAARRQIVCSASSLADGRTPQFVHDEILAHYTGCMARTEMERRKRLVASAPSE